MHGMTKAFGRHAAAAMVGLVLAAMAATTSAEAQGNERAPRRYPGPPFVVAESDFGNGRIAGPIRQSRHGWQVRMPRGTWIDCVRSCADTLRRETIDFWQTHGPNAPGSGPGYFIWDFYF
jgi:hypothetical protein